jgi:hypothetical protein
MKRAAVRGHLSWGPINSYGLKASQEADVKAIGLTLTRLLTTAFSLALIACLTACGISGPENSGGETHSPGASNSIDPKTTVLRAFQQLTVRPFRLRETTTMTGPGGSAVTMSRVMEFAPPNRYHAVLDTREMIWVGDDQYQRLDGKWSKTIAAGKRGANQQVGAQIGQAIQSGALVVSFVGNDSVDGKPARLYRIAGSVAIGETLLKGEYKAWLSTTEDWPLKLVGKTEPPRELESVITYEYDPGIRIEAPVP